MIEQPASLIGEVRDLGGGPSTLVAVELESFFAGNQDVASIAPNLLEHPGPQRIYEVLSMLRDRADVSSVAVLVRLEFEDYPDGEWPFGEAVQVVTSAPLAEVDSITAQVQSDPAFEGPWLSAIENSPRIPAGEQLVTVWWD